MEDPRKLILEELALSGEASPVSPALLELCGHRITPGSSLPPVEFLFRLFGRPCFPRGELVGVAGKAKSGKTMFTSMLMAACLTQKVLAIEREVGLTDGTDDTDGLESAEREVGLTDGTDDTDGLGRERGARDGLRVLWLDTEQSQQSTQDIMLHRIIPIVRALKEGDEGQVESVKKFDDYFFAYNLRGLGFEKRRELMKVAIAEVRPDLVIIDGIKDLVTDINDAVQATLIMEQLMALAQAYHCCIVNVLHQNKSEADQNMRGSIGTELANKAFEVYTCEFIEERDTFKVSQRLSRRERVKRKLYFRIGDDGLPVVCEEVCEQPRDAQGRWMRVTDGNQKTPAADCGTSTAERRAELRKLFTDVMEGRQQRPFGEVMAIALKHCGMLDAKMYYGCVREAEEQGIIRKVVHPETGRTWVQLLDNQLPF